MTQRSLTIRVDLFGAERNRNFSEQVNQPLLPFDLT